MGSETIGRVEVDHHRELAEDPQGLLVDDAEAFLEIGAGGRLPGLLGHSICVTESAACPPAVISN
jgi:hypothetical protein